MNLFFLIFVFYFTVLSLLTYCVYSLNKETTRQYIILEKIKRSIQEWEDKQNHDICWWYPEIFAKIKEDLGLPQPQQNIPSFPRQEFERGCKKEADKIYAK